MSVVRVEKNQNYTVMSNEHLQDMRLSLKAKGLMSWMLSLPDNWDYTIEGTAKIMKEGRDAIRGAFKELEEAGYLVRENSRNNLGKFVTSFTLYEQSQTDSGVEPCRIIRHGKPVTENPTQINTNNTNTKKSKKVGKRERRLSYDEILDSLVGTKDNEPELREAWAEYLSMRMMQKKAPTNAGLRELVKKSKGLGNDPVLSLKQATINCSMDLYPYREPKKSGKRGRGKRGIIDEQKSVSIPYSKMSDELSDVTY